MATVNDGRINGTYTSASGASTDVLRITDCPRTETVKADIMVEDFGSATVDLQRSRDNSTWYTVESYTADTHKVLETGGGWYYRFNCGTWASGTIVYDMSVN